MQPEVKAAREAVLAGLRPGDRSARLAAVSAAAMADEYDWSGRFSADLLARLLTRPEFECRGYLTVPDYYELHPETWARVARGAVQVKAELMGAKDIGPILVNPTQRSWVGLASATVRRAEADYLPWAEFVARYPRYTKGEWEERYCAPRRRLNAARDTLGCLERHGVVWVGDPHHGKLGARYRAHGLAQDGVALGDHIVTVWVAEGRRVLTADGGAAHEREIIARARWELWSGGAAPIPDYIKVSEWNAYPSNMLSRLATRVERMIREGGHPAAPATWRERGGVSHSV